MSKLDKIACVNKADSQVLELSEKRDAVHTGLIEAAGKIARLAAVAEYREPTGTATLRSCIELAQT